MITRDQVGEALKFIAETDHDYAAAKTEVERMTWLCKHARALVYEMTDPNAKVDERKQAVERDQKIADVEDRRIAAIMALEELKAKRETQFLRIEVWRTVESSRRAGIV